MTEPAATERLDGRTVLLLLVTVVALTIVDAVLGRTLSQSMVPALVVDAAVVLAVLIAARNVLAAALLAAAASIAVSGAVSDPSLREWAFRHDIIVGNNVVVGLGAWPGIGELVGMAVLCAMAIRYRPTAEALLAAAAFGGALLAIVAWRQQGTYDRVFLLVLGVAFAATVAVGIYSRSIEQRRAEDVRATRQAERDAIARELHDVVAHHVTGIVVQAQAARLVADARPDVTAHALSSIEQAGADALSSMRAMVGTLRADSGDAPIAPIAPTATVDDLRRLAAPGGIAPPVVVSLDPAAERLPSAVIASLHRIAIEALTNARRHGTGTTAIDVTVACGPRHVTLTVANDGAVVTERQQGFGLVGIAERVAALDGQFEAGPRPTGGWAVTAVLPTSHGDDRPR